MKSAKVLLLTLIITAIISCRENKTITTGDLNLRFSTDTVLFDTVFTGIGTTTQKVTVHNPNNQKVRIKTIYLAKGNASNFSINVDGQSGPTVRSVEISQHDSIYIFVEANIDPGHDEMVEIDSILFESDNTYSNIKIVAFGQDVNLVNGQRLTTQTWTNKKPYLVYNYALIEKDHTLTIEAGTAIHFHYGSSMIIDGTLKVAGSTTEPVIFRSDRLEPFYKDKPGQWGAWVETDNNEIYLLGGLHFTQKSKNNRIDNAIIENAIVGIQLDSVPGESAPGLELSNTIIRHMNQIGIIAKTSSIKSHNLVINNCGVHALALLLGGNYQFNHATIVNYTPYTSRSTPAVIIKNYYTYDNAIYTYPLEQCSFTNSIIHGFQGDTQSELGLDLNTETQANYLFDHCILQIGSSIDTTNTIHFRNIKTAPQGVRFKDISKYNFELDTLSPAKDIGLETYGNEAPFDIKGCSRTSDTRPDLGAYERVE